MISRRRTAVLISTLCAGLILSAPAQAASGSADLRSVDTYEGLTDVVATPGGTAGYVAVGSSLTASSGGSFDNAIKLYGLDSRGRSVASFGENGLVTITIHEQSVSPRLAAAPDGGVYVLLGQRIARITPSGELDTSWAEQGFASVRHPLHGVSGFRFEWTANPRDIVVLPDGRILISGAISKNDSVYPTTQVYLGRFLPSGSLDTAYEDGGFHAPFAFGAQSTHHLLESSSGIAVAWEAISRMPPHSIALATVNSAGEGEANVRYGLGGEYPRLDDAGLGGWVSLLPWRRFSNPAQTIERSSTATNHRSSLLAAGNESRSSTTAPRRWSWAGRDGSPRRRSPRNWICRRPGVTPCGAISPPASRAQSPLTSERLWSDSSPSSGKALSPRCGRCRHRARLR